MSPISGRHLLFLGALAAAGLTSVRDSQEQVGLGYEIAKVEADLRKTREAIAAETARVQAAQAPARIIERARELELKVAPASALALYKPEGATQPDRPQH
jgi:hypothetical protein